MGKAFLFLAACRGSLDASLSGEAAVGTGAMGAAREQFLHFEGDAVVSGCERLHRRRAAIGQCGVAGALNTDAHGVADSLQRVAESSGMSFSPVQPSGRRSSVGVDGIS